MNLKGRFTDHLASVGEIYPEHMQVALSFALPLMRAAAAAYVHAFLPFLFTTTASGIVKTLYDRMTRRCSTCASGPAHRPDLFARPATLPARARSCWPGTRPSETFHRAPFPDGTGGARLASSERERKRESLPRA